MGMDTAQSFHRCGAKGGAFNEVLFTYLTFSLSRNLRSSDDSPLEIVELSDNEVEGGDNQSHCPTPDYVEENESVENEKRNILDTPSGLY